MTKKVNKKKQSIEPRERIITSAVKLFARSGFARTGLRELATAADVNLAMINYFFGSKKGLLKEILDRFFSGYLEIAHDELSKDDEVQVKFGRFIRRSINYFALQTDYLLVTIAEMPHDDAEITEHKATWGREMMAILDREICTPLSLNTGKKISPRILGPMLTSVMASRFLFAPILENLQNDLVTNANTEEYSDIISNFLLNGLGTLASNSVIKPHELPKELHQPVVICGTLEEKLAPLEREIITKALEHHEWLQTKAAEELGISERVLRNKMTKLKIIVIN